MLHRWAGLICCLHTVSRAVQGILSSLISAASETPWLFCLLFIAVTFCRNKWLGACDHRHDSGPARFVWGSNATILEWLITPLLAVGLMLFAIRYGLFALVAAMFVVSLLRDVPLTLDSSAFYFSTSLAALTTVLGLGIYAYWNAIAGRRLFS